MKFYLTFFLVFTSLTSFAEIVPIEDSNGDHSYLASDVYEISEEGKSKYSLDFLCESLGTSKQHIYGEIIEQCTSEKRILSNMLRKKCEWNDRKQLVLELQFNCVDKDSKF